MQTNNQRIMCIDYIRVIAILMVVLCHAIEAIYRLSFEYLNTISFHSKAFAIACFTLGRIGVPLFLLITGYLLLDRTYDPDRIKRFWLRNWLHLLVCTWVWFLIYEGVLIVIFDTQIGPLQIVEDMLFIHNVRLSHAWYLTMILGMYVLIPFVAIILQSFDTSVLAFPLILFTAYAFVYPFLSVVNSVLKPEYPLVNQFSLGFSGGAYGIYIVLGFLLKRGLLKRINTIVLGSFSVIAFAMLVWFQIWVYGHDITYNVWYDNILLLFVSVCGFETLSRLHYSFGYGTIKEISYFSFSIYLIHNLVIRFILPYMTSFSCINPVKVLMTWFISIVLSYVIAKLISMIPKVGKYILYIKQ